MSSTPPPKPLGAMPVPTWTRLNPALSGATLLDLDGDGAVGFAVGRGVILRTLDGGETWADLPAPLHALRAVSVAGDTVWIGGDGVLLRSDDQGRTWRDLGTSDAIVAVGGGAAGAALATAEGVLITPDGRRHDRRVRDVVAVGGGWLCQADDALLWLSADGRLTTVWEPLDRAPLLALQVTGADVDVLTRLRDADADTRWVHLRVPEQPEGHWWPETSTELKTGLLQRRVVRGEGWLAIGGDGHASWRSTDGGHTWARSWDKADLSATTSLNTRAMWAAPAGLIAAAGTALLRSTDGGHAWQVVDGRPVDFLWGGTIDPDGGLWLAAPNTVIHTSTGWSRVAPLVESLSGHTVPLGLPGYLFDAAVADGAAVLVGSHGIWRGDAEGWEQTEAATGRIRAVLPVGDALVAMGSQMLRSTSGGRSWRAVSTRWPSELWGMGADGERVWAVGESGLTVTSDDAGRTWSVLDGGSDGHLSDVALSGEVAIAVGSRGTILRSDGGPWQPLDSGTDAELRGIWHDRSADTWVVIGGSGVALRSTDGRTWTAEESGSDQELWGIFGDHAGRVIAVGTGGVVLERRLP
jgi:photosystem II stability/assembly factor-like uncharacterized protein